MIHGSKFISWHNPDANPLADIQKTMDICYEAIRKTAETLKKGLPHLVPPDKSKTLPTGRVMPVKRHNAGPTEQPFRNRGKSKKRR